MKTFENLPQGSDSWLEVRLNHFTASEAPAMMNESKYMTRNQLLDLKKGWQNNPDSSFKEKLYSDGHKFEAEARSIIEDKFNEELYPITGKTIVEGIELLASFDGVTMDYTDSWEHKSYNETLAENVRNNLLEGHYYWQLEHQMLVLGTNQCWFTVSNGTAEKMINMNYRSIPERRLQLITGWKQFAKDLEVHELKAKVEKVVGQDTEDFPMITYEVHGTEIQSNIGNCLVAFKERSEIELTRALESDQDFHNKDQLNKATKKARADLKAMVEDVQNEFVSYSVFANTAKEIDSVLQKMQSHGEKQVKEAKAAKKSAIIVLSANEINRYVISINLTIDPINLRSLINTDPNFDLAMKGKRTIESLQNACDSVVADFKIEADKMANKVKENLLTMRELASEYKFLFSDTNQLVTKDNEDLIAVIKTRIADHAKSEIERLGKEREQIRIEEERKAQQKVDDEQAALKAKKEAEERGRIAKEAAEKRESEVAPSPGASSTACDDQHIPEQEDVPHETVEDDLPFTDKAESNSLLEDIDNWARLHLVSLGALDDLSETLKRHGIDLKSW